MSLLKILCIGDVVGNGGCRYLEGGRLRKKARELGADLIIVNGENSASGNGMSRDSAHSLLDSGADVVTGGNHTFKRREIYDMLDDERALLRPANYPSSVPGVGYGIYDCNGWRVLVINLLGCVFMESLASPFETAEKILNSEKGRYDISIIDIHAEATSEKMCLARYLDGKASVVFGTHTHVQTTDATVLPGGTGYITDLGMTGSMNGILGVKTENIIHKFTIKTPIFFEAAEGNEAAHGALFTVDTQTGKCTAAEAVIF